LEAAWEMLRGTEKGIPPAVITLINAGLRRRLHGYFAASTWKGRRNAAHEISISPMLIDHRDDLIATMLHEAAHAVLFEAGGNGGMGSTGYYHTITFRDQCLSLGLACEFKDTRYGWTLTSWPGKKIPPRYQAVAAYLRTELPAGIGAPKPSLRKGKPLPLTGHTKLVCGCEESERSVYVKKSVLELGGIVCLFCRCLFTTPDA
jgi:hypothetical protein